MRKLALVAFVVAFVLGGCWFAKTQVKEPPMTVAKKAADSLDGASKDIKASATTIQGAATAAKPKAPQEAGVILGQVPVLQQIADALTGISTTLNQAIADELKADKETITKLNQEILDLKAQNEANMTNTFRMGVIVSLIFIALGSYLALKGAVSWLVVGVGTGMLAMLLALMRYAKIVAEIGLGLIILVIIATLAYAIYRLIVAHGSITEAIDAAKADMAKAVTGVEALGILKTSLTTTQRTAGTQATNDALRGVTSPAPVADVPPKT